MDAAPTVGKPPIRQKRRNGTPPDSIPVHCAHTRLARLDELKPNPRNPNQHPPEQVKLLAKIIQTTGWRASIVVSKRSGFITKGHGRYGAAQLLGVDTAPIDEQDYPSEAAEIADLIADNQIAELANLDTELLSGLVLDLDKMDFDLSLTALSKEETDQMLGKIVPTEATEQSIPEKWAVLIDCANEKEQKRMLKKFTSEGLNCRALIS